MHHLSLTAILLIRVRYELLLDLIGKYNFQVRHRRNGFHLLILRRDVFLFKN